MPSITNAVVEQVSVKPRTTKFGTKDTYSFRAGGEWYNTGFKKHNLNVGNAASFEYVDGSYGKDVDVTTIKKGTPSIATPTSTGVPRSSASTSGKGVFPIPPLDGQRSIVRQNALTNARELICARINHTGKWSDVDNLVVANTIIDVARIFEAYTAGDIDAEEVEREIAEEMKAAA